MDSDQTIMWSEAFPYFVRAIDNKFQVDVAILDFAKAFD